VVLSRGRNGRPAPLLGCLRWLLAAAGRWPLAAGKPRRRRGAAYAHALFREGRYGGGPQGRGHRAGALRAPARIACLVRAGATPTEVRLVLIADAGQHKL